MAQAQSDFLSLFKDAFASRFGNSVHWNGGQGAGNVAQLPGIAELRRGGVLHRMEQFEIGDLRGDFNGRTLVIEYEQKQLSLSNLVKYWPYVRGELNVKPECPIVLCHFSNWWSYGTYRDLWNWVMLRMETDTERIVDIHGHQFDHGGPDAWLRESGVCAALDWIAHVYGRRERFRKVIDRGWSVKIVLPRQLNR
jgi:hypothetical protein